MPATPPLPIRRHGPGARPLPGSAPACVLALSLALVVSLAPALPAAAQLPAAGSGGEGVRGGGLVVDAAWLRSNLETPGLVLLHVGSAFDEGHVPGSRPLAWDAIAESRGERGEADWVRLDLPAELTPVRTAFEAAGVGDDSRVVVVFEGTNAPMATRVLWTLQVLGLGDRAALLDGGLDAWRAAGGALATGPAAAVEPGRITRPARLDRRAERAEVRALADASAGAGAPPAPVLLDARRPSSWDGAREELPGRAGHIPGARSLHAMALFDEAGRLRPEGELRDLFAEVGVGEGDTVVAYCHIGLWASSVVFAARTLGIDARLYDGSMTEWASDPALPLALPAGDGGNRRPR